VIAVENVELRRLRIVALLAERALHVLALERELRAAGRHVERDRVGGLGRGPGVALRSARAVDDE